jgi:phosphoribosyl-dephospho-CoA transferase
MAMAIDLGALTIEVEVSDETKGALDAVSKALEAALESDQWHRFDRMARREEMRYEAAAIILFNKERDQIAKRIQRAVPIQAKAEDPHPAVADPLIEAALLKIAADYAPGGAYHRAWLERYRSLISATVVMGGRELSNQVGLSFSLRNPKAMEAIRRRVTKLTGHVTQTTIQRVRDVVAAAREEGVGVTEVARRIRSDAFGNDISRSRAQTIARTETVGALNEGEFLAASERGVMQSKRWLSQRDGRVRDSHAAAENDAWISIDGTFSNGLRYPHEAGAPADETINCRCTLLYSDEPPDQANARRT